MNQSTEVLHVESVAPHRLDRYTATAMLLHWIMAALIVALLIVGWYMADLPKGTERSALIALHKSLGLTLFALLVARIVWRLRHRPPPLPSTMPAWEQRAAHGNHYLLYFLMLLQPVSGYLSSSFSGYKTSYFGIALPNWGWHDKVLNEFFNTMHAVDAYILLAVVIVHVLAALRHLLIARDRVFQRMLP